jgi:hypothetical protein
VRALDHGVRGLHGGCGRVILLLPGHRDGGVLGRPSTTVVGLWIPFPGSPFHLRSEPCRTLFPGAEPELGCDDGARADLRLAGPAFPHR